MYTASVKGFGLGVDIDPELRQYQCESSGWIWKDGKCSEPAGGTTQKEFDCRASGGSWDGSACLHGAQKKESPPPSSTPSSSSGGSTAKNAEDKTWWASMAPGWKIGLVVLGALGLFAVVNSSSRSKSDPEDN